MFTKVLATPATPNACSALPSRNTKRPECHGESDDGGDDGESDDGGDDGESDDVGDDGESDDGGDDGESDDGGDDEDVVVDDVPEMAMAIIH